MTKTPAEISAAFDELLADGRRGFGRLYDDGSKSEPDVASPTQSANARLAAAEDRPRDPDEAPYRLETSSPVIRQLNEKFGNAWRYEIRERRRVGNEAVVLCELVYGKQRTTRTQFGRATIASGPLTGESAGVRFKLAGAATGTADERAAFRHAAEAALKKCAELV